MQKRSLLSLACLSLAVLTGCSSASGAQTPTAAAKQDKAHWIEVAKADCMKQKGFKYVPFVQPITLSDQNKKASTGDLDAMRAKREKYGHGIFAMFVYPKELGSPAVLPDKLPPPNPNATIQGALSPAQRDAYQAAAETCWTAAIKKATGMTVASMMDWSEQGDALRIQIRTRELDGDPKLVELSAAMADCLKGKGYRIAAANPTALDERGPKLFEAQKTEIAKNDDIPDSKLPKGQYYEPTNLTPTLARPYLDKEIKDALDDLECGKEFYPAFLPKADEIARRVDAEFGFVSYS